MLAYIHTSYHYSSYLSQDQQTKKGLRSFVLKFSWFHGKISDSLWMLWSSPHPVSWTLTSPRFAWTAGETLHWKSVRKTVHYFHKCLHSLWSHLILDLHLMPENHSFSFKNVKERFSWATDDSVSSDRSSSTKFRDIIGSAPKIESFTQYRSINFR